VAPLCSRLGMETGHVGVILDVSSLSSHTLPAHQDEDRRSSPNLLAAARRFAREGACGSILHLQHQHTTYVALLMPPLNFLLT
jgi:hypothetical protein